MKYTRRKAEQVFKDFNKWVNDTLELYDLQKQFLDDKFSPQLPEKGWLKCANGAIIYRTGNKSGYGINCTGKWQNIENWSFASTPYAWRKATKEEVEDALIDFARKQGYKNGNYKCLMVPNETVKVKEDVFYVYIWDDYINVFHGKKYGLYNLIFNSYTGEWAKIIEDENKELKEQIEKLENQLNELKSRL